LSINDCPKTAVEKRAVAHYPYAEAVGTLQWLVGTTRPEIAYAVSHVSTFLANWGKKHWEAVKHIMLYLKATRDVKLRFKSPSSKDNFMQLTAYADADWANCKDSRRSQGGYIVKVGGNLVFARSMKQRIVTLSSMEAEFVAAAECAKEVVWMRRLLLDLGFPQMEPTSIFEDNQSCICLSLNPVTHSRSKHIDVRFWFLRQLVAEEELLLDKIGTLDQEADILTKGSFEQKLFIKLRNRMFNCS
jgi:hypothetical protein